MRALPAIEAFCDYRLDAIAIQAEIGGVARKLGEGAANEVSDNDDDKVQMRAALALTDRRNA